MCYMSLEVESTNLLSKTRGATGSLSRWKCCKKQQHNNWNSNSKKNYFDRLRCKKGEVLNTVGLVEGAKTEEKKIEINNARHVMRSTVIQSLNDTHKSIT